MRPYDTRWGAVVLPDGRARFRLWAPDERALKLWTEAGETLMTPAGDSWFELVTDAVAVGDPYMFVLDNGTRVPDPAARAQVGDVHGPSRLVDPSAYLWTSTWSGRPWNETVIYELHVGTFTPEGTFRAAMEKLPHLASVGITAIEVMPLAQFAGRRGWGYDGVYLYAPHNAYGTPDDFRAFVDAAHASGLMVFLDVVYNHFGPEGNYLGAYAKTFFHEERHTPWGAAIAFDEPAVRDFFVDNAVFWLTDYRLDGLRFDAIDHIDGEADAPILEAQARKIRELFGNAVHLHTEDERNIIRLHPYADKRPQMFTAEWNDDYHNVVHPIMTGESEGYYDDFCTEPFAKLARGLAEGFIFQGDPSKGHGGKLRGEISTDQPMQAFVVFNQNHDQVGNRAFGDRLIGISEREVLIAFTAVLLLQPQIPLLFMGEEYGETRPFCFFTDFDGNLADLVREGRRSEFKKFKAFDDPAERETIPDPNAESTFLSCKLDWGRADSEDGRVWLELYRTLLDVRANEIAPRIDGGAPTAGRIKHCAGRVVDVEWTMNDGATLAMYINMGPEDAGMVPIDERLIAAVNYGALATRVRRPPHSVVVTIKDPA